MKQNFLRSFYAIFAAALFCASAFAQPASRETFAITNARIVPVAGATIERGTVVVRDGLIEAVGASVRVPSDARVIDGAGLTVYPGFIDAFNSVGFGAARPATPAQPAAQTQAAQNQTNSNYPNGLQPETAAFDQLRAGEGQFEPLRNSGFTTALTVSRDGVFNGQSALINLAGETVSEMVVRTPVAQHVTFRTLGGTYPTSLMGTFSALRQMLLDARRLQQNKKQYDADPRGLRRPEQDASLEALFPVLDRQMPVVFNANSEREILRVLDLAQEFNIRAIIAGGQEAWKVADRLKKQDVPVLLSLNFPRRTTSAQPEADQESLDLMRLRAEAPKGAGRLAAAGVRFAFQTGGLTNANDYFANAARAVENGLSRDAAIRAMTLSAAEIFGVENRLGSIERGKIANLVVTRGDVLARDKTVTHVFVDGKLFEQRPPARTAPGRGTGTGAGTGTTTTPGGATPAFANVTGAWNLQIEIPGQPTAATLTLTGQGRTLTGSLASPFGTVPVKDGEVLSDGVRFSASIEYSGSTMDITVNAKVSGNQMTGTINTTQGPIPFTGTRNP